jgi:hypothetical protein
MLQEQQLLMAHSMLTLKNNLLALAIKEEETRKLITLLAESTQKRFEQLENRVDQLEISSNLQGWVLTLEERAYDEKYPTEFMRLFRVINDFYTIKNDNWNYNDLMFMRKAIRSVKIEPRKIITLNLFIDNLIDEILNVVGIDTYSSFLTEFAPPPVENYSIYVIDNISSLIFISMHRLKTQYTDRLDDIYELQDELNISTAEALKRLLRRSISQLNVNLNYEFPMAEAAIEILSCIHLVTKLALFSNEQMDLPKSDDLSDNTIEISSEESTTVNLKFDAHKLSMTPWQTTNYDLTLFTKPSLFLIAGYNGLSCCPINAFYINNYIFVITYDHTRKSTYINYSKDGSTWARKHVLDENDKKTDFNLDNHFFVYQNKLILYSYASFNDDVKFYSFSFDDYRFHSLLDKQSSETIRTSDNSPLKVEAFYPFEAHNIVLARGENHIGALFEKNSTSSSKIFISNDLLYWQVIHTPFKIENLYFDGEKILCQEYDFSEKVYFVELS